MAPSCDAQVSGTWPRCGASGSSAWANTASEVDSDSNMVHLDKASMNVTVDLRFASSDLPRGFIASLGKRSSVS